MCAILAPGVAVTLATMRGNSAITPAHSCLVFGTVCGVQTSGELPPQKKLRAFLPSAVATISAPGSAGVEGDSWSEI